MTELEKYAKSETRRRKVNFKAAHGECWPQTAADLDAADRSMRSGTELAPEIRLTDWYMTGNLSNRSSEVQIPRDICTRLER